MHDGKTAINSLNQKQARAASNREMHRASVDKLRRRLHNVTWRPRRRWRWRRQKSGEKQPQATTTTADEMETTRNEMSGRIKSSTRGLYALVDLDTALCKMADKMPSGIARRERQQHEEEYEKQREELAALICRAVRAHQIGRVVKCQLTVTGMMQVARGAT